MPVSLLNTVLKAPPTGGVANVPLCTRLCPRGTTPAAPIKSGNFTFCICGITWKSFNSGPGYVTLDPSEQMANINLGGNGPGPPLKSLWFRSGAQGRVVGSSTPAWDLEALLGFDEVTPGGAASVAASWMVGFIQTVESLEWEATYSNGWSRKAQVPKSRDAATGTVPAPWYAPAGSGANGQPIALDKVDTDHPLLTDEPMVKLAVVHPDPKAWCTRISSVSLKGSFLIWLIALDPKVMPLSIASLVFLRNASVKTEKKWDLPAGADPFDVTKWNATGNQTKTGDSPGKGTNSPILDQPVANTGLVFATPTPGTPCQGKPPAK